MNRGEVMGQTPTPLPTFLWDAKKFVTLHAQTYNNSMTSTSIVRTGHYRALVRLGLPIIIGQIGTIILGVADTLMIGHHTTTELAAAAFVNGIFNLAFMFSIGFCNGFLPVVGGHYGRGEHREICETLRSSLWSGAQMTVLLMAALTIAYLCLGHMGQPEVLLPFIRPYYLIQLASIPFVVLFNTLRQFSDGMMQTRVSMWIVVVGNVLNIFGNYILIYGHLGMPELGLAGAGLSTLFSRIVMVVIFVAVLVFSQRFRSMMQHWHTTKASRAGVAQLNKLGWPVALQMAMEGSAFSLVSIIVGWIGVVALAAHQILVIASQFCYFICSGMAMAVAIRISLFAGQKDAQGVKDSLKAGLVLVMALMVLTGIVVASIRWHLGGLFTDNKDVSLLVGLCVVPLLAYQVSDAIQFTLSNALRGLSQVKLLVPYAFISYYVVSLPLSYYLAIPMGWGLEGIWWAFLAGLTVAAVLYFTAYRQAFHIVFGKEA